MNTFYFVRHGQTDWNKKGIMQGQTNTQLNEIGRSQAQEMRLKLKGIDFDYIYSSDLDRCITTLKIIKDRKFKTTKKLREQYWGSYEKKPIKNMERDLNKALSSCLDRGNLQLIDEETDYKVFKRASSFLTKIGKTYNNKTILIMTHGGVMRLLLVHLGFFTYESLTEHDIKNTSYFVLKYSRNKFSIKNLYL